MPVLRRRARVPRRPHRAVPRGRGGGPRSEQVSGRRRPVRGDDGLPGHGGGGHPHHADRRARLGRLRRVGGRRDRSRRRRLARRGRAGHTRRGEELVDLPVIGPVDVGSASLVVATLVIGLVDGVNPCSLWVLSVLLALVLRSGSRKRVLAIGGTFLAITAALYALYIAGMYGVLSLLAHQRWVRMAMALVALAFGLVNLKDFFAFRRGVSLTIPEDRKPN